MRFRCTFSHFSRCIHFPKLLKKATFSHLKGICSQKRMLGHKPNNLQGHLSLLEPLLLCALAQNSQHLPATTAVNLLRSLGRSSSWILLASPLVSSFFLYDRNGILKFYNWTDGLHHMYMMIGWKDERTKAIFLSRKFGVARCCRDLVLFPAMVVDYCHFWPEYWRSYNVLSISCGSMGQYH